MAAPAARPTDAPDWTDEPPVLSRLIERGFADQSAGQPVAAATAYCQAARLGSAEAQYLLARLYLEGVDVQHDAALAANLLSAAAQRGHVAAQQTLSDQAAQGRVSAPSARLPDCIETGGAVVMGVISRLPPLPPAPLIEPPVPLEVVQRFVERLPQDKRRHAEMIKRLAPRFDVDPRLALAIVRMESNFEADALSSKNAMGLMQLIADTAERFGVRDPWNPEQNVRGGLAYLRFLLQRFDGDIALASAAYNAGEGAVDRHGGVPPFAETREYVRRILGFYRSPKHQPLM